MDLVEIYQCFCDRTRLRILHLLLEGPLCVCHVQAVLEEPQVKISKHLSYLRQRGLVEAERRGQWMVYSLPAAAPKELQSNLACLQDCAREESIFRDDLTRLRQLAPDVAPCGCDAP